MKIVSEEIMHIGTPASLAKVIGESAIPLRGSDFDIPVTPTIAKRASQSIAPYHLRAIDRE
jgi:hypothetical protein